MLTAIQESHVQQAYPDCREEMADFLSHGTEVFVARQHESGAGVPPFAIRVVGQPEFWMGCAHSARAAVQLARDLGLKVIKPTAM